ncbi:MAG TPA: 3-oxoacyl-ACP synthase [Candidatus Omnitrophica bacterium]|nr:3-oxoacyl-ACP synthase [Candidatus Omnitrophota bacterium]
MGALIKKIEYYLPEKVLTNSQLQEEFKDCDAKKIEDKIGIRQRHIVQENETALDLAYNASEKNLAGYDRSKIDFLILCTQSPDYYLPTSSCILQHKLNLKTDIGAFDFNLGCSGFVYGLALAKSLLNSNIANSILLIMSETYSKHINPKDKANRSIFGDAAATAIIEKSEDEGVFEFSLGTDGSGYKNLIIPNGGLRKRYDINARNIDDGQGTIRTENDLYMNGPEMLNFMIESVPKVVLNVLKKNKTTLDELDYVIFHQANGYIIEYLRKKIKIPKDKFYTNLLYTGNTVSASIPIAIKDCLDNKIIRQGNKILIVGFGVGYSWGGTIIKI